MKSSQKEFLCIYNAFLIILGKDQSYLHIFYRIEVTIKDSLKLKFEESRKYNQLQFSLKKSLF
jgi:hypothetical protein